MPDHDDTKAPGMMRIDDDDVEGHGGTMRIADEDDVEGHGMTLRIDDDVEGHNFKTARIDADEDDVEGHFGQLRSPTSRGE